ncbi:MAG: hypothetical protein IJC25_06175 [Clostridia bacterium]|nr:hypothetical protein [Clostridia bacterium]MBQ9938783.1 hypothetical protein [Oscillospiraceae bacterium]
MDIKAKIEELVARIKSDDALRKQFQSEPVKALESLLGVDLPDDQIKQLVDGIKAKLAVDDIGSVLGGLFGKK